MPLSASPIQISLPAHDKQRAKQFFAQQLDLHPYAESGFGVYYQTGGTKLAIVESDSAGSASYSLMTWLVADIASEMAVLRARGVVFLDYDELDRKTVNGIYTIYSDQIAWFKDSEGNMLALAQID